jgi:hypothetical protein
MPFTCHATHLVCRRHQHYHNDHHRRRRHHRRPLSSPAVLQVIVKKVQVRSVDRNIAQLRAKQAGGASNQQTSVLQGAPRDFRPASAGAVGSSSFTASVDQLFDSAVSFALGPENAHLLEPGRTDTAAAFLERVDSAQPPDAALSCRILRDAFGSQLVDVAAAAVASPLEFHRAFHLLSVPLRTRSGLVFDAAAGVLQSFAAECANAHRANARSLFLDMAMHVVVRVAGTLAAPELRQLVAVCDAFGGGSPRFCLEVLRAFRDSMEAVPRGSDADALFLRVLAATAGLDDGSSADEPPLPTELLDLYLLYCRGGLTAADPALRRVSIHLLATVAQWCHHAAVTADDRAPVKPVAELVTPLCSAVGGEEDEETVGAFLRTAAVLLQVLQAGEGSEELEARLWPLVVSAADPQVRARRLAVVVPFAPTRGVEELLKLDGPVLTALLADPDAVRSVVVVVEWLLSLA